MKIYLINLDRSPERLAFMADQFRAQGLSFERIAAVDGAKLDLAPYVGSPLSPSEIGCFLSHRAIWSALLETHDDFAVAVEDDVNLSPDFHLVVRDMNWIPADARVVKLDTATRWVGLSRSAVTAPADRCLRRLLTMHTGTSAYIVGREGAKDFLGRSHFPCEPVDISCSGMRRCGAKAPASTSSCRRRRFRSSGPPGRGERPSRV